MEPFEAEVVRLVYTTQAHVLKINPAPEGWWVHFEGSRESIFFNGKTQPYKPGDRVKITFEKVS